MIFIENMVLIPHLIGTDLLTVYLKIMGIIPELIGTVSKPQGRLGIESYD